MAKKEPFFVEYEDNHLIIVNKRSGVLVQGDRTGDKALSESVKDYIRVKYEKPGKVFCGVIHRIDRPVSGLVCLARTSKGLERMNGLLREKKLYKTYWALVKRKPREDSGKLTHWIVKDGQKNKVTAYNDDSEGGLKAELRYQVLGFMNDHYLLEVYPITGRPHQIRSQLAAIGSPIRGDIKYGFAKPNPDKSINLHARKLHFEHPIKKEKIQVVGSVPDDQFWEQFLAFDKVSDKDIRTIIGDVE
jgi:23S rRNA pseudouridine1911/1915/1917 synthase